MKEEKKGYAHVLTGVTGEYYVAAELSKRGHIATITLRNTGGVDILASNSKATKQAAIQVKTSSRATKHWPLNEKAERYHGKRLFYVFVALKGGDERPDFHIVPSEIVAHQIKQEHRKWLRTPGKHGRKHRDNPVRVFRDKEDKYIEKWKALGL